MFISCCRLCVYPSTYTHLQPYSLENNVVGILGTNIDAYDGHIHFWFISFTVRRLNGCSGGCSCPLSLYEWNSVASIIEKQSIEECVDEVDCRQTFFYNVDENYPMKRFSLIMSLIYLCPGNWSQWVFIVDSVDFDSECPNKLYHSNIITLS